MTGNIEALNNLVVIQEVGLRDGLQNEELILTPEQRANLVNELVDSGIRHIQIGSFVNPSLVPQMAHTDRVWELIQKVPDVRYSVLILNEKGLMKAIQVGVPHIEIYVSASDTHSRKNSNSSSEQALMRALDMVRTALDEQCTVTAGIMCAFGCRYEGEIAVEKVQEIVSAFSDLDCHEIGLADTTGMGTPEKVRGLIEMSVSFIELNDLTLHFHDTYGFGIANIKEALKLGVRNFDASVGGLGGCPFVPGAAGNISTHRAVRAVESFGFRTGIDTAGLDSVQLKLEGLLGRDLEQV